MISNITYIPTKEGWLYLSELWICVVRKSLVGVSMGSRMTKELVINVEMQ